MLRYVMLLSIILALGVGLRQRRSRADSCSSIGCGAGYNPSLDCQCNDRCREFGNCCDDYGDLCEGGGGESCTGRCGSFDSSEPCQCNSGCSQFGDCCTDYNRVCFDSPSPNPSPAPAPTPPMNSSQYWQGVDLSSMSATQARLQDGSRRLSYTPGIWDFYKEGWVNLPGGCQGGLLEVYSSKCWTPGSGQCGSGGTSGEGQCYNREHSWPKSWWGGNTGDAYNDILMVFPSDGYVNTIRSNNLFGEVSSPTWISREGNKRGPCSSGTCFEPTDRVKGLLARASLYMAVRYMDEFSCCSNDAVDGATMKPAYASLMLKWHEEHPPAAWEIEMNNRAQAWQGNRNPFIDFPELAQQFFR